MYILNLRNVRDVPEESELQASDSRRQSHVLLSGGHHVDESEILQLKMLIKSLSDKNDDLGTEVEKMKILERNYDELVRSSELSDDDKTQLLIRSLERCHEFETNLKVYERKIDFLKSDNDTMHLEMKALRISSMELVTELQMEILEKSQELDMIEMNQENTEDTDVSELRSELHQIRTQLNGFCFNVLKNIKTIDEENVLNINMDQLANVTVLENNLSTSFITRKELSKLRSQIDELQVTIKAHETKEKHLEELTKITQSQLKSQQLMLSQFSDEEISARHLIVDLQSQSHENYQLAKATRELKTAKEREDQMKLEIDQLKAEVGDMRERLSKREKKIEEKYVAMKQSQANNLLKIQYLKKTLKDLCNQFSSMTPVYLIADFVKDYAAVLETKKQFEVELAKARSQALPELSIELIVDQIKDASLPKTDIEARIEIIKQKSSCDYLKQQLEMQEATIKDLHSEVARAKISEIKNNQHWKAIKMLFGEKSSEKTAEVPKVKMVNQAIQTEVARRDCATNTDEFTFVSQQPITSTHQTQVPSQKGSPGQQSTHGQPATESAVNTTFTVTQDQQPIMIDNKSVKHDHNSPDHQPTYYEQKSLESQLKTALMLASSRSALLIETENSLSEAQGRIKFMERTLETKQKQKENDSERLIEHVRKDDHVLSITIATLQNLLLEKDTTLSRYQELLKSERQHHSRAYDELTDEVKQLKRIIDDQETSIIEKIKMNEKLRTEIVELERKVQEGSKVQARVPSHEASNDRHVTFEHDIELRSNELKLKESHTELKKMEQQLKDLVNTERQLQSLLRDKDAAIKDLNSKLKASNDNLDTLSENFASNTEIDQLRDMLEEKDKHIQDLTETLNQFHDDQQKYINDSAINSAEQVHLISADLNRAESTNRVLKTQLEALKRQIASIQQREKQAREMIKTLKNQLIRRPVISVKSDKRPATAREEQLQKKVNEIENELVEVKDDLRRQTNINDNKKAKNAAELGLWDKQKRYQELSERLKAKLTEKEIDYERMKANFQIAKNNITRLERERTMLENKLKSGRYLHNVAAQQSTCVHCHPQKYSVAETLTTGTSDSGSDLNHELISALKNRIESQQRRIISLELEGKGSNAVAHEIDRIQEHLSSVESQNIRLEAKNIQLQLDFDLLKQNDSCHRQEARIKHLEE